MAEKSRLILAAEESLARRIALGVIVRRPVNPWLQLIPGMFIIDFLKRTAEVRRFSQYYMFPRRLAMEAARRTSDSQVQEDGLIYVEERVKNWLSKQTLYSQAAHQGVTALVDLLTDHYSKLLRSDGNTHQDLVNKAYVSQAGYQTYLDRLASMEKQVDLAVVERLGGDETLRQRCMAQQEQAEEQRTKDTEAIFF